MKAQHISSALFCLSVVIFSCKRETASLMPNNGLAVTSDSPSISLQQTYSATSDVGVSNVGFFGGDFNGDGYTDVLHPWVNNGKFAFRVHDISGSGTFLLCDQFDSTDVPINASIKFLAGDHDGDGKTDLIQVLRKNDTMAFRVFRSTGSAFIKTYEGTMNTLAYNNGLLAVDVDGDGKTDVAQIYSNSKGNLTIKIYHSTGTGFEEYPNVAQTGGVLLLSEGIFAADWDGDGKMEIVQTWDNNGSLGYYVYHSTDGRTYSTAYAGTFPEAARNLPLIPLDYNGDGKVDFLQTWNNGGNINVNLYQSNGNSYTEIGNFPTVPGRTYLGWFAVKRPGQSDGFLKVWNNNSIAAFYRFDFVN